MVSLENADRQILAIVATLTGIGVLIILFVCISNTYFVKSILNPVREINSTAKNELPKVILMPLYRKAQR